MIEMIGKMMDEIPEGIDETYFSLYKEQHELFHMLNNRAFLLFNKKLPI